MKAQDREVTELIDRLRAVGRGSDFVDIPEARRLMTEAADTLFRVVRKSERRSKQLRKHQVEGERVTDDLKGWYERAVEAEEQVVALTVKVEALESDLAEARGELRALRARDWRE